MTQKRICLLICCIAFVFAFSQKKEQLQKQNADLKKQIAAINQNLAKTRQDAKLSVAYLNDVNKKIELREKVYSNTQKEKRLIEDDIYLRQLEINRQNRELAVLRGNYAQVLVKAYKNKGVQNKVTFILSSKNLGEALRRIQYLKQYADYQEKKATEIYKKSNQIKVTINSKQKSVQDKNNLLANQAQDLKVISAERLQKEQLLKEFKQNEVKLTAELKQKQAESKKLEGQIRTIIAEEIRIAKAEEAARKAAEAEKIRLAKIAAAKEKARIDAENKAKADALEKERRAAEEAVRKANELAAKKAAEEKKRTEDAAKAEADAKAIAKKDAAAKDAADAAAKAKAAEDKLAAAKAAEAALAKKNEDAKKAAETKTMTAFGVNSGNVANFASARGQLTMPVYGTVTHRFGRQPHPVFKNIMEDNTGIKIAVAPGTKARCVFPGVVSSVQVNGGTKTVIVRHGEYFTIYSNLSDANVSKGQQVAAGTVIGQVGVDFDGSTTLDFQIWNGTTPIDPLGWVSY